MNQLIERFAPWAPLALLLGIVASLVEAAEERDVSSAVLLLVSLAAALVLLRIKRGLTRGEVRAEIDAGIRARVRPESMIDPPRVIPRRSVRWEEPNSERTLDIPKVPKEVP